MGIDILKYNFRIIIVDKKQLKEDGGSNNQ